MSEVGSAGSQLLAAPRCRWSRSTRYSAGVARSSVATAGSSTSHSWVRPLQGGAAGWVGGRVGVCGVCGGVGGWVGGVCQ